MGLGERRGGRGGRIQERKALRQATGVDSSGKTGETEISVATRKCRGAVGCLLRRDRGEEGRTRLGPGRGPGEERAHTGKVTTVLTVGVQKASDVRAVQPERWEGGTLPHELSRVLCGRREALVCPQAQEAGQVWGWDGSQGQFAAGSGEEGPRAWPGGRLPCRGGKGLRRLF